MSQQINLFNPIFLKEKKHFSAKTMGQGLLLIAVCVLLLFGYSRYQSWRLDKEAVKVAAQLKDTQQQLAKVNATFTERKKNLQLEEEVKRAEQEAGAMQQALVRLRNEEFGTQKGFSDYLGAFARKIMQGVWLTGFSIENGGSAIGISGGALKPELIPAYMNRLKQEPVLQGKAFSALEIRQPKESEQKSVSAATPGPKKDSAPPLPAYVEFDLRSEGVEKAVDKSGVSSGAKAVTMTPDAGATHPANGAQKP